MNARNLETRKNMSNRFGDSSFSDLLHTPFSQLHNLQPAEKKELSFVVYDLEKGVRPKETLMLDRRIDEESRVMFNTFEATFLQVFSLDMTNPYITPLQVAKSTYDYSSLVSPLSQIWELELNNSVVQMIRQENGIEMPRYYKRVKRDEDNRVENVCISFEVNKELRTFNLNKLAKDDELKPQMMGDIYELMKRYNRQLSESLGVSPKDFCEFTEIIKTVKNKRNLSAHPHVLQENDFREFYEKFFCKLIKDGWLTIIMNGKDLVRNQR